MGDLNRTIPRACGVVAVADRGVATRFENKTLLAVPAILAGRDTKLEAVGRLAGLAAVAAAATTGADAAGAATETN